MKKKFKRKLILFFTALASLFILGGCKIGETLEEVLDSRDLVSQVSYYANGGEFDGDPDVKEMYYTAGSEVMNVGVAGTLNGTATLRRGFHDFGGWYYAELDNGEPVFEDEEKKKPKASDTPVVFPLTIEEGEHLYFVAKWIPHVKVQVQLKFYGLDGKENTAPNLSISVNGKTFKSGDVLESFSFTDGKVSSPGSGNAYAPFSTPQISGYTFVDYYELDLAAEEGKPLQKTPLSWPIEQSPVVEGEDPTDTIVYAKYILGDWKIVREGADVANMFGASNEGKKYWLVKDIDARTEKYNTLVSRTIAPMEAFNSEIQGNGFTISYLSIDERDVEGNVSLFGNIASSAVIANLTIENLSIRYRIKTNATVNAYFAFTEMDANAQISNVVLKGTITCPTTASDGREIIPRLYGNKTGVSSDEEYVAATGGAEFTVQITE